jgi:hypothetical protein
MKISCFPLRSAGRQSKSRKHDGVITCRAFIWCPAEQKHGTAQISHQGVAAVNIVVGFFPSFSKKKQLSKDKKVSFT